MLNKGLVGFALATLALAQSSVLTFTSVPNPVTDGQPQAITYATNDTVTPVTITLRQGVSTDLQTLYNLTTTALGGSFVWTPRTDLPNGADYALQITQNNQTNYYGPFRVQGYTGPLSSSASSAASTSQSSTITSGALLSSGTGSAMPRNTTFVSATLSSTVVTTSTAVLSSSRTSTATTTGTGAANAKAHIGSSLALVGAIAALLV